MSRRSSQGGREPHSLPAWRRALRHPLAHLAAALLVVALVQGFLVKVYQVPSGSMEQTLLVGDRLLVNRLAYTDNGPGLGDVVVFERPAGWSEPRPDRGALRTMVGWFGDIFGFGPSNSDALVKRVIGVGGDTISCCDAQGRLLRNGQPLDESYLGSDLPFVPDERDCGTTPRSSRCFPEVRVPEGHYLVLGDNRASSGDGIIGCRGADPEAAPGCARFVPRASIVGEVFFVVLPFDRWGTPLR